MISITSQIEIWNQWDTLSRTESGRTSWPFFWRGFGRSGDTFTTERPSQVIEYTREHDGNQPGHFSIRNWNHTSAKSKEACPPRDISGLVCISRE